jgi:hypothetical protein
MFFGLWTETTTEVRRFIGNFVHIYGISYRLAGRFRLRYIDRGTRNAPMCGYSAFHWWITIPPNEPKRSRPGRP